MQDLEARIHVVGMIDEVARSVLDNVFADLHAEEAVLTPASSPRVFESDVRIAAQAVSHSQDGVVNSRSTAGRVVGGVVDSRRVVPEATGDLEGDSDGSLAQILEESVHSVLRKNDGARLDGIFVNEREAIANTIGGGVGERGLLMNAVFNDVVKSLMWPASTATEVTP